jgi:hypothetical protein
MSYHIIKFPRGKEKHDFYYYKQFDDTCPKSSLVTVDPTRSVYICSFTQELEEGFVKKYMGLAGHIQSVYIGIYKHRKGNKKKRRTIFYAIVTYKTEQGLQNCLNSDSIQHKIDNLRQVGKFGKYLCRPKLSQS